MAKSAIGAVFLGWTIACGAQAEPQSVFGLTLGAPVGALPCKYLRAWDEKWEGREFCFEDVLKRHKALDAASGIFALWWREDVLPPWVANPQIFITLREGRLVRIAFEVSQTGEAAALSAMEGKWGPPLKQESRYRSDKSRNSISMSYVWTGSGFTASFGDVPGSRYVWFAISSEDAEVPAAPPVARGKAL